MTRGENGPRVAVTGAMGRLGRVVCSELAASGHSVVGIDRVSPGGVDVPLYRHVTSELADGAELRAAFAGCDAVVHLAALPAPTAGPPTLVWGANCTTTGTVFFAAAEAGVRSIVFASSQSALGLPWSQTVVPPAYLPVDEDHPCWPADAYSASKVACETLAEAACRQGIVDIRCLRFPVIWVPEMHAEQVASRLRAPEQGAKSLWAYVDGRDAARAVRLCVEQPRRGFEVLNITATQAFADRPVPELVSTWFPALADIRVPLADDTAVFDWRRAASAIGFRARFRWTAAGIHR